MTKTTSHKYNKTIYFWWLNDYIYMPNVDWEAFKLEGIFEGDVEDVDAAKFETETPRAEPEVDYNLPPTQIAEQEENKVKDAADFDEYASAPEKKSECVPDIDPEETTVGDDEIVDVNDIINEEPIIIQAKTLEALNGDAVAKAATASFTQQLEAKKVTGTVSATSTVQGQMEKLMNQFNDGTPAWGDFNPDVINFYIYAYNEDQIFDMLGDEYFLITVDQTD